MFESLTVLLYDYFTEGSVKRIMKKIVPLSLGLADYILLTESPSRLK